MEKDDHVGCPFVRHVAKSRSLSKDALKSSHLHGEWEQRMRYNSYIERFVKFCCEKYTDHIQATTEMEFLTGVGYSSVNSAGSALSIIIKPVCNVPFGRSSLIC